jgi:AcrR family transcriptional regulator
MANTKDNRRVKYTKDVIRRSLLALLKEKAIDKITVKEICEKADINRGTFYTYYENPFHLLTTVETEFYVDVLSDVVSFQHPEDVTMIFTRGLTALKEHGELASVLFGEHCDSEFLAKLVDVARELCIQTWSKASPDTPKEVLERMYDFVSYGSTRVIQQWLQSGMKESPAEVAEFLNTICNNGVLSIINI